MFVTTWNNKDEHANDMFIRLHSTLDKAIEEATKDCNATLADFYQNHVADQVLDITSDQTLGDTTIVRIINPNNGYEYESYVIKDHPVW